MAVTRTILPRKGLIQPQHGLTGWETDQDGNWALLDANVAFLADLQYRDLGMNGVISGFALSTSVSLAPGLSAGVLYSQGIRYAPALAPGLGPAPASETSYLFYNSNSGFYYQSVAIGANSGDALVGQVVTGPAAVTSVAAATRIYGQVVASPAAAGNFTLPHGLGRTPLGAVIQMTSGGAIYFQAAGMFDGTNVYLVASNAGVTGQIQVW
ncbi:MAG TPA: hypothetical protein VKM93_08425 [Terriglobia bacterium]|nr:hypothetical protein [Terriglobia bacterium]